MKKVNALELRQSLGKVIADLEETGEPILVEKGRRPVAVLISLEDFRERFAEKAAIEERDRAIEDMDALARPGIGPLSGLEILRRARGYED